MPFKTKKRKAAAKHHVVEINPGGTVSYTGGSRYLDEGSGEKSGSNKVLDRANGADLKSELSRILLLAGVIIGLQLALKLVDLPILK